MLNPHMIQTLQNLIGWALDQDHDMPDYPEHLDDLAETTADELSRIADALALSQKTPAREESQARYVKAARALAENLPDSIKPTDEIRSTADADDVLREFEDHAGALKQARAEVGQNIWLVPAPWDAPALELEPQSEEEEDPIAQLHWLENTGSGSDELARVMLAGSGSDELARVMLAAGALYAAGKGSLSQCMHTAVVWERG